MSSQLKFNRLLGRLITASFMTVGVMTGPAGAGGLPDPQSSLKDDAAAPSVREYELSANVAIASDYVSRGFTQTAGGPSIQGGFDLLWKSFYVGVWASNVRYENSPWTFGEANIEVDVYAGVRKKYNGVEFDFAVFYMAYPNAIDPFGNFDYWELKAGVSSYVREGLKLGINLYYSPDYFEETGDNWIFEAYFERALPKFWKFTPSITGLIAYQEGDESKGGYDYWYWDVGLVLAFHQHYKLDLRYHDTIDVPFGCDHLCDGRFVAALKAQF